MMLPLYNKSSENASVSEKIREQRIRFARAEGSRISQHSGGIGCTDLAGRCDKPRIRNDRHLRIVRPVGQSLAVGFDLVLLSGMEISSSAVQSQKA